MATVNKVILVGNCGRDPDIRYLPNSNSFGVTYEEIHIAEVYQLMWETLLWQQQVEDLCGPLVDVFAPLHDHAHTLWDALMECAPTQKIVIPGSQYTRPVPCKTLHQKARRVPPCQGFFSSTKSNLRNAP
jgi:hypothetical protein